MMQETEVLDRLSRSKVYQDFERAFREVTRVPLRLAAPNKGISADNGNGHRYAHQFLDKTEICASWRQDHRSAPDGTTGS